MWGLNSQYYKKSRKRRNDRLVQSSIMMLYYLPKLPFGVVLYIVGFILSQQFCLSCEGFVSTYTNIGLRWRTSLTHGDPVEISSTGRRDWSISLNAYSFLTYFLTCTYLPTCIPSNLTTARRLFAPSVLDKQELIDVQKCLKIFYF